jgi:DNA-damage-inducible protein J
MYSVNSALKATEVRSRISHELKMEASDVLNGCGLNVSSAIRLFLEQVVREQRIPFEVKRRVPSAKMAIALKEAELIEKQFSSMDEMMKELEAGEKNSK